MSNNRNNYLSTAKGIGIILMVMGHCGVPEPMGKFIYQFHMPLFFFCSGFFFKNIKDFNSFYYFIKKRFKGIYLKFIFWSFLFLSLHNFFFYLNVYNDIILFQGQPSYLYSFSDYLNKAFKIAFSMNEHEQLIRSFWFLKSLFLSSILVATLIYSTNKLTTRRHAHLIVLIGLFLMTLISKYYNWTLPAIWDISLVFMSATFYLSGYIFRTYQILNKLNYITISIVLFSFLIIGLYILPWTNMLEYSFSTTIPYFIVAISGTILTVNISQALEKYEIKHFLYYIGQNTMVIFALHMLCFKIGNLIKIGIYEMPIYHLAEFQIIYEHNSLFWIVYTIIGISIPLLINVIMKRSQITKRIWSYMV